MSWFTDPLGNTFTTSDGQPPSGHGAHVQIGTGYGETKPGWWNGHIVIPNN